MSDPNLVDFYTRIARIERARAKGYGFQASGTLGRYQPHRATRRRTPVLGIIVLVALCAFGLKGAIHATVGGNIYEQRVDRLRASEGFDRLGGWLMQADPVTLWVSAQILLLKADL